MERIKMSFGFGCMQTSMNGTGRSGRNAAHGRHFSGYRLQLLRYGSWLKQADAEDLSDQPLSLRPLYSDGQADRQLLQYRSRYLPLLREPVGGLRGGLFDFYFMHAQGVDDHGHFKECRT